MNKRHHHPTQPQLQPHLPTQQLLAHPHLPILHHNLHNLAIQYLNLPQLLPILPPSLHTNQVINPQGKVVSAKVDSMVKISENKCSKLNFLEQVLNPISLREKQT